MTSFFPPPSSLPSNMALYAQDIFDSWPSCYLGSFDYVHQHMDLASPGPISLETHITKFVELVKSGKWIELLGANIRP
jgi:hypothetical protein